MRLKKIKNAKETVEKGKYYIKEPQIYKGIWNSVFNNNNKIYVELGIGKGSFIIENALKYPQINFIGIEKYDSVLIRAIEKSNILELPNLKLIMLDVKDISNIFNKEIDKIYLNFSDPWPKERHAKRRLTSPTFLKLYDNLFKEEKIIEMKTDNINLFNYSIEQLKEHNYKLTYLTNDLASEQIDNIKTEYEEKFLNKGIKINKLVAKKK